MTRRMKNLRHTGRAVFSVVALGAGLAACGGSTTGPTTDSGRLSQGDQAFLQFTVCMRRHGVQMADPYRRTGSSGLTLDLPEKTPAVARASASCHHYITSIEAMKAAGMRARQDGLSYQQRSARHLGLVHYAQCMRAREIPMLDPDANDNLSLGDVPGIAAVGRYTPLFREADHACRGRLPAGVSDNGTGP
jgi:hypothetical protein